MALFTFATLAQKRRLLFDKYFPVNSFHLDINEGGLRLTSRAIISDHNEASIACRQNITGEVLLGVNVSTTGQMMLHFGALPKPGNLINADMRLKADKESRLLSMVTNIGYKNVFAQVESAFVESQPIFGGEALFSSNGFFAGLQLTTAARYDWKKGNILLGYQDCTRGMFVNTALGGESFSGIQFYKITPNILVGAETNLDIKNREVKTAGMLLAYSIGPCNIVRFKGDWKGRCCFGISHFLKHGIEVYLAAQGDASQLKDWNSYAVGIGVDFCTD